MTDKEVGFNDELGFSDEPSPNDHLGMGSYIEGFSTYITHCPTPMTAAIQGDWGSGKTTALWAIKKELQKPSKDDYWVIDFNTWQYSQFDLGEQLVFSLIKEIIDRITERVQALETANDSQLETKVEKIKEKGRGVLRFLAPLARKTANIAGVGLVVDIADAVKEGLDNAKSSEDPQEAPDVTRSISKLRTELEELVDTIVTAGEGEEPLAKRLFVFIDDLDRLEPARAVEVMEALKVFLNIKGCVFVLAIDFSVVASGVKTKYGNDFEESKARAFFDKIIQIPFNLPVGSYSIEGLLGEGLKAIGIEIDKEGPEFEGFKNLVRFSVGTNPRSIKRLINTFGLLATIQGVESTKGKSVEDNGNAQPSPLDLFAALAFQTAFPQIFENLMREMIFDKDPVDFFDEVIEQLTGMRAGEIESDQLEEWGLDRSRVGAATKFFKELMSHFFVPGDKKKGGEDDREQAAQRIAAALGVAAVTAVGAGDIADSALRRSGASVLEDLDTRLKGMPNKYEKAKKILRAFDDEINRAFGEGGIVAGDTGVYWSYASRKPELMIDRVQSRRFCEVPYNRSGIRVEFGNYLEPDVFEKCQQEVESLGLNINHSTKSSPPLKIKGITTVEDAKKAARIIAKLYRRPQE